MYTTNNISVLSKLLIVTMSHINQFALFMFISLILNNYNYIIGKHKYSETKNPDSLNDIQFSYWLVGLINSDGSLLVSKKGYTSCEITVNTKEIQALYKIKEVLGGSISKISKTKAFRWRLHNKKGMIKSINLINGKLLLKTKHKQLINVCIVLDIVPNIVNKFSSNNSWLSGFMDGDGSFNIKSTNYQLSITIGQKNKCIPEKRTKAFSVGKVYEDKYWNGWVLWISDSEYLSKFVDYFTKFPLKTSKNIDFIRFKRFILYKKRRYHLEPKKALNRKKNWII